MKINEGILTFRKKKWERDREGEGEGGEGEVTPP